MQKLTSLSDIQAADYWKWFYEYCLGIKTSATYQFNFQSGDGAHPIFVSDELTFADLLNGFRKFGLDIVCPKMTDVLDARSCLNGLRRCKGDYVSFLVQEPLQNDAFINKILMSRLNTSTLLESLLLFLYLKIELKTLGSVRAGLRVPVLATTFKGNSYVVIEYGDYHVFIYFYPGTYFLRKSDNYSFDVFQGYLR